MLPDPIKKFVKIFSSLPAIGPRQATRLAFYLVNLGRGQIAEVSQTIAGLALIKTCPECFYIHQTRGELCHICSDPNRRRDLLMIVEKETDLMSLEKTKKINGRYLILGVVERGGLLDQAQKLKLRALVRRGPFAEIILGLNPTVYGDLAAAAISNEIKGAAGKITRLGRGLPTGGEIEFADEETLAGALENRS